jgi:two-component system, sensor histidine kinase and response regulator
MKVGKELQRDLERRLEEAEATIAALLSGQIDAVVDSASATPVLLAKAQDALRQSEEHLRHERDRAQRYLDTADVILLALDLNGCITLVNRYACSMLGWTAEELLGRPWIETCVPERARNAVRERFRLIYGGDLSVGKNPIMTKRDEERLIEWRTTLLRDDDGLVAGTLCSGIDITERHEASESLRLTEERTRFALEAAGVGIWDMDSTTGLVQWSAVLESQHGLQAGTFGGTIDAFLEDVHADDRESTRQTIGAVMKSGGDFSEVHRSIWPDGTVRWLSGAGRVVLSADGKPGRAVGISHDITERKHAEMALQAITADLIERTKILEQQTAVLSEQAALLDLTPDAIVVQDMHGRVVFWSRGAEVLYGWLRRDALGRDTRELLKTNFPDSFETEFLRLGQWEGEAIHHSRDGAPLTVASRWTIQRDTHGAPVRILTISNNITARKQVEQALEELSQRTQRRERILTTTLSFISDFAYIYDRAGRLLFVNQPLLDLWGITLEDAVGKGFLELGYSKDTAEKLHRQVNEVFVTKKSLTDETAYTSPKGLAGYYEYIFSPVFGTDGTVEFVAGCTRDITGRKQAEAELRTAKEAAESANKAKSEFLANMSHEIRTPMNGVLGMTDQVLDTELTDDQRQNLQTVKSCGGALMTIINDILDFSRIEARKLELQQVDFNVQDIIGDAADAVALRAQQKGIELIVDIRPAVPSTLKGDPGRLRQILINLFGNAIKFTHQGEVVLRVTREAAVPPNNVMLHFAVTDTGIGIPWNRQQKIFEAFTQADGSMTRVYGGTGLGLTISSQLVQLMGGRLWVESEAGCGSTFHFTAYFESAATYNAQRDNPGIDGILRDLPVLVVDGNLTNRRVLEQMLAGWGMVPTVAASTSEALAQMHLAHQAGRSYRLVLTDSRMPGEDGFILAETVIKEPTLARTPIVMLTSAGQPGGAARCRELGIAAYLSKPAKQSQLRRAIHVALGIKEASIDEPILARHFPPRSPKSGHILVVDDNVVNQAVAKHLLERRGHTVILANDGHEALRLLESATSDGFDCVLMDVQMPHMGGFECTAVIRENERTTGSHLPIIGMTADAMEGDDARCLRAGMDAYVSKPLDAAIFRDVVERHLRLAVA